MKDHNPSPITRQATGVAGKGGELEALLARVEAATGPDRELEKALWYKLIFDPALDRKDDSYLKLVGTGFPRYTASLDAALALVERVLPGWGCVVTLPLGGGGYAQVFNAEGREYDRHGEIGALSEWIDAGPCHSATAPLAVIAALLSALSHQPPRAPDEPGDRAREETKS